MSVSGSTIQQQAPVFSASCSESTMSLKVELGPLDKLDAFYVEDAALQELPGRLGVEHVDRSAVVELG